MIGKKGVSSELIVLIGAIGLIVILALFQANIQAYVDKVAGTKTAPAIQTTGPDTQTWYGTVLVTWLGLGDNWALVISSLMVVLILVTAFIDILSSMSMFGKTASVLIAIGIAIITSVAGGTRTIALLCFAIGGGVGIISVAIGIIVPFVGFIILNIFFGKAFAKFKGKKTAQEIETAADEVGATAHAMRNIGRQLRKKPGE